MKSSYRPEEVTLLLKDITGQITPLDTIVREQRIQSGTHYCEMLPKESPSSADYLRIFHQVLASHARPTAQAIALVSEQIYRDKGEAAVLVSLARAGTPIGVLIRRYLQWKYQCSVPHYTISIIRGRGIDTNAMDYLLARHPKESLQFVDGWTGKGAIQSQLTKAMQSYPGVDDGVAVVSDPAHMAGKWGTHCDFLIPSACLNATVSGLISRTVLRDDLIAPTDFHGACYYADLAAEDLTAHFLDSVTAQFANTYTIHEPALDPAYTPLDEVKRIGAMYHITSQHRIKPGVGETTRVLLRRIPWKILVHRLDDDEHLGHIYQLAKEKQVPLEVYPLRYYLACGLIQDLSAEGRG